MIPPRLLSDGLLRSAARHPDKIAVRDEQSAWTYAQLREGAERVAACLLDRGLPRGGRVIIYLDNSGVCAAAIYGVMLAGGVFVTVNPQTKSGKLRFILEDADAFALVTDKHLAVQYESAVAGLDCLQVVLSHGVPDNPAGAPCRLDLAAVLAGGRRLDKPVPVVGCDLAALIYTSGSTGQPKGVMQTHQSMVFAAWSIMEYLELVPEDRILLVLPMAFDYGLYQLLMAVFVGATLVVERSFAFPGRVYAVMAEQQVTVFPGVPTIYATMQAAHLKAPMAFPSVRAVTNTAAALLPHLLPTLAEVFPNARVFKMYGLTECKRVAYLPPALLHSHPRSVGIAIPGTEISLHAPDGSPVAPGQPGILHVRGPHVMVGYWKRPDQTAHMLREGPVPGERVLVTHDWFTQDADGLLQFVGRSDDIIKSRGEKVSPVEVETLLCRMDGIAQAAVVGVPDAALGERIRAFVVLDDAEAAANVNANTVKRFCSLHLENFMVPQEVVVLPDFPRTENGKVDRKLLAQEDGPYAPGVV